jgi:elongation factor Tu
MFQMVAKDIFHIEGHGTVLTGQIQSGRVALGNPVEVFSPSKMARGVVAGLEKLGTREIIRSAKKGDKVGICVRLLSIDQIDDGVERLEPFGWKIVSLRLRGVRRPWWKFWDASAALAALVI